MNSWLSIRAIGVLGSVLFVSEQAYAGPIDLSIVNPNRIGAPGQSFLFQGTITNNTGFTLNSTDLFLNFSGYDPANVTLDQVLGLTDFSIPNGSTSGIVDLLTFALATTASVPATYPADVVLEGSSGDFSATQTVSVSTIVPEPGSLALAGMGALVLFLLCALQKRIKLLLPILAVVAIAPTLSTAQVSAVQFLTSQPGLAAVGPTMMVALPIINNGSLNATNVQVTGVTLQTAPLVSPLSFPVMLGTITPAHSAVFQANFNTTGLGSNTSHLLTVRGTYQVGSATAGFTVNRFIVPPPASSGSALVKTTTIDSHSVSGAPFPHQPFDLEDDNRSAPPVPTAPFVPGTPTPVSTSTIRAPTISGMGTQAPVQAQAFPITFNVNNGLGLTSGNTNGTALTIAEPSGATGGGVVFVAANLTAAYSTDGGSTFTQLDPTRIFPNDAVGYCCDQIVQYVSSIDRFIWLLQGSTGMASAGYRLASASPAQISSSGGTAWTYWNLTTTVFGPNGSNFDYPDLSVGNNYLYISWDANCSPNCAGFQVARVPLTQIQAGGTIGIDYTNPSDSPIGIVWGTHITQNTQGEIFWAGHNGNNLLRVFSLAEGSGTYFWRDIGISSWANNSPISSVTPDNQNWVNFLFNPTAQNPGGGFPSNGIIGATRSSNQLWFAWSAGTDSNFQQPHVEMVTLDRSNNFNKIQQVQIWNNSYAFAYPALATNACTGEIGLSLEYGGNGNFENHVVGFWGDFVVYITTNSSTGTTRFGDYVTIRQDPGFNGAFFDAFGYGLNGTQTDIRYVVFGRSIPPGTFGCLGTQ